MLAQVEIRDRTRGDCVADNGFCPEWIADNLDRYCRPVLAARLPDRRLGRRSASRSPFALGAARPPPPLARRADHQRDRDPLHDPQRRAVLPAAADHRPRRTRRRSSRSTAYTLLILFRNIDRRARRRARGGARRRARHGPHAAPAAVAGRAAARAAGDPRRRCASRPRRPSAWPRWRSSPAPAGSARQLNSDTTFKSNVVVAGGAVRAARRRARRAHPARPAR